MNQQAPFDKIRHKMSQQDNNAMKNNWKEEFDKEFTHNKDGKFWSTDGLGYEVAPEEVKYFVTSLLTEQKKELMEKVRLNCFLVDDVDNQRRDVPCIEYVKLKDIIENHD